MKQAAQAAHPRQGLRSEQDLPVQSSSRLARRAMPSDKHRMNHDTSASRARRVSARATSNPTGCPCSDSSSTLPPSANTTSAALRSAAKSMASSGLS